MWVVPPNVGLRRRAQVVNLWIGKIMLSKMYHILPIWNEFHEFGIIVVCANPVYGM